MTFRLVSERSLRSLAALIGLTALALVARAGQIDQPVSLSKDGKLVYAADAKGNRVPDFSFAGYRGGGVPVPFATAQTLVEPSGGDDTAAIQGAIDHVATLPLDANGLRGAVLLAKGRYHVRGALRISTSGVVLRGSGSGSEGTVLLAEGTDRRAVIQIQGTQDRALVGNPLKVFNDYVPVGANKLKIERASTLHAGDVLCIRHPSTKEWIKQIGMDDAPARSGFFWRPGTLDVSWLRRVVSVKDDEVELDAPLTTALDSAVGGATMQVCRWPGRLVNVGVERLRCDSAYNPENPKDEQHAWIAVQVDAAEDVWVRDVVAEHFVYSAVYLGEGAQRVTVADCASLNPVSELAGYRRHTFFTAGQQTLFLRCRSQAGLHDFVTGYLAAGPNVFLECAADGALGFSGSVGSWASGILFDNVVIDGDELRLDNLETWNQGVGWAAANSMIWQSKAARFICRSPAGAANWACGVWGMFVGDGRWSRSSEFVDPDSLYRAQLIERLGKNADQALAELKTWPQENAQLRRFEAPAAEKGEAPKKNGLTLQNGWLVSDGKLLIGSNEEVSWWRGQLAPGRADEEKGSITRFVPGRVGPGLTDDLDELTNALKAAHRVTMRHHWGLWYDRRSDDHQMVRRPDADVWPPFFEQPWLRSGKGEAWDRLSKYDLSQYNPWYFGRLRQFAEVARRKDLVLVNEMFFQHNILEAGAHWATFPWRPANCIQDTGFPEPPPYVGDKRNFMAEIFYDLSSPVRRDLYAAYIRHCLDNLADQPNVIHTTGAEFTGPLSFMQFWLDTVAAWEQQSGRTPLIALSANKDVQDAVLDDSARRDLIGVIDFTYWYQTAKGLYAPKSGQNLSPRQSEREWKGGKPDAISMGRMAREYRVRFPQKAIMTSLAQGDGWAFVAAGGSFPMLPATTDARLLAAIPKMYPARGDAKARSWTLSESGKQWFVYAAAGEVAKLDLSAEQGSFRLHRIDPKSGAVEDTNETVAAGKVIDLPTASGKPTIVWLTRE